MPPCFSISSRNGPFLRLERISLLSPQISLFVQPLIWRPRVSKSKSPGWNIASSCLSARGSSTCSITWNGSTTLVTSFVLPFHTSSTCHLSSKSRKRYLSGNGLPSARYLLTSRISVSVSCIGVISSPRYHPVIHTINSSTYFTLHCWLDIPSQSSSNSDEVQHYPHSLLHLLYFLLPGVYLS